MIALSTTPANAPLVTPAECSTLLLPSGDSVGIGAQRVAIAAIGYEELLYLETSAVMGGAQAVSLPELPALLYEAGRKVWAADAVVELELASKHYYLRVLPTKLHLEKGAKAWTEHHFLNVAHSRGDVLLVGRERGQRLYAWVSEPATAVLLYNAQGRMATHTVPLETLAPDGWPDAVKAWAVDFYAMKALLPQPEARLMAWKVTAGQREAHFALAPTSWRATVFAFRNHIGLEEVCSLFGERRYVGKVEHDEAMIGGMRVGTTTETTATLEITTLPLGLANSLVAEELARSVAMEEVATGTPFLYREGTLERSEQAGALNSYKLSFVQVRGVDAAMRRGKFTSEWTATYD